MHEKNSDMSGTLIFGLDITDYLKAVSQKLPFNEFERKSLFIFLSLILKAFTKTRNVTTIILLPSAISFENYCVYGYKRNRLSAG